MTEITAAEATKILEGLLTEARFKRVIRKGKLRRKVICPKGRKAVGGICVVLSGKERVKRRLAARRAARKARPKLTRAIRRRKISMKRRKSFGL